MEHHLLAVGLGGASGAVLRVLLSRLLPSTLWLHFPLPILLINIFGCLIMGCLTEAMALYWTPSPFIRSFLTTGLLGGFTTFSAFSLEFGLLAEKQLYGWAILYVSTSVIGSLSAFFIGTKLLKGF